MKKFDRITSNPHILGGQPTIRGMRLTVRRVVEALALYPNWDDLRREYPELELEVDAKLEHCLRRVPEYGNRVLRVVADRSVSPTRVITVYFDRGAKVNP